MFEGNDGIIYSLVSEGRLVDRPRLAQTWEEHRRTSRPLADLLLARGLLEKPALLRAVATHLGTECVETVPARLAPETVALVDGGLARTYGVVPLAVDAGGLHVLAVDPFNSQLVGDLTFALDREIRLAVADPDQVAALVRVCYGEDDETLEAAAGELQTQAAARAAAAEPSDADLEQLAGQAPIVRFVNLVLSQAIRDRASDIHFEPFEREFKVRCRVDGTLVEMAPPPCALALPIVSRLKVLANLDIAERRMPQDGRIRLNLTGRAVDLRVATLPTQFGESVVLRVLDRSAIGLDLAQLGLPADIERPVREIIRRPHGIFVVTGPTGSGKTTTLYSCLRQLHTADVKILTVEDPVEYEIDGIMQVPVNPAAGLTFARALRAFLRQDPDIVMVGEIRDLETAEIAIQASLTGHLVLSTLHTNDAPGAIARLADLGVEKFLLASTIEGVLAQRLVRRICPDCRTAFAPPENLLRELGADVSHVADRPFYRGRGCPACHGSGYRGRTGLFELLCLNDELRELVVAGAPPGQFRRRTAELGLVPLRTAGLRAILDGETTAEEVARYT
jgi:type IV pilus assembly protein PilB